MLMKMKFKKRAVLFLDILGFRQIVQNCVKNPKDIENVYEALSIIKTHFSNYNDILKIQFSDSIVISFRANDPGSVIELIGSLQSLTKKFAINGYLLRGGLTYGDVFHDSDFIFGPAMNKAYDLESKLAVSPRILIDNDIIEFGQKYLPEFFNEGMENYVFNYVSKDSDDKYYIDYFQKGVDTFWEIEQNDKDFIQALEKIIKHGLNEEKDCIYRKYLWMKDKFNQMVFELKNNKQVSAGGFVLGSNKQDSFYSALKQIVHDRY